MPDFFAFLPANQKAVIFIKPTGAKKAKSFSKSWQSFGE
jgi:hypothetical protein